MHKCLRKKIILIKRLINKIFVVYSYVTNGDPIMYLGLSTQRKCKLGAICIIISLNIWIKIWMNDYTSYPFNCSWILSKKNIVKLIMILIWLWL